jgi:hypothetical protein
MHNNQWQPVEGRIVDAQPAHGRHEYNFTVEARNVHGAMIRRIIRHKVQPPYPVGTTVKVQIDQANEIRFDPNYPGDSAIVATMSMSDQIQEAGAAFSQPGAQGPNFNTFDGFGAGSAGGPAFMAGGAGGVAGFLGMLSAAGTSVQVMGPDGQPMAVNSNEVAQLAQTMMSGDPVAKQEALQRLHAIRDAARGQAAAGGYGQPAAESPAQRLEALQALYSQGLLTEAEYETKRQQVINGL